MGYNADNQYIPLVEDDQGEGIKDFVEDPEIKKENMLKQLEEMEKKFKHQMEQLKDRKEEPM